mmetsp:Transcript_11931/g.35730  ORF Transcript_11931/g.35730 Transcript_11931/m.35730 type:complete len:159 (+) Transcript_11931:264-740(+)|eukprot:CAMPEP_0206148584 /NCGR_PEP_ID=MMETSP1473-20131121/37059_1 /ASSEMBLY_ACC=CAM_ASM_001109 /TAXON_ID=1461547 /ORGANISM="Stichococcus sp, Strain RCC1054" /LENGTH=158 /DNA_ID=CAMNT_0053545965 /DNA_START=242 /DNA_END=718 /DNA_ORIENTATION=-
MAANSRAAAHAALTPDAHRRFGMLLKHFHNDLRSGLDKLIKGCEKYSASGSGSIQPLILSTRRYFHSLETHHGIEDTHVFPFLAKKMDVSSLQHDHEEMERLIDSIKVSCKAGGEGLEGNLRALQAMMLPHMAEEERVTAPAALLAAGITQADMRRLI